MPSLNWKIPDQSVLGESLQDSADQIWLTQPWFPVLVSGDQYEINTGFKLVKPQRRKSSPDQPRISKYSHTACIKRSNTEGIFISLESIHGSTWSHSFPYWGLFWNFRHWRFCSSTIHTIHRTMCDWTCWSIRVNYNCSGKHHLSADWWKEFTTSGLRILLGMSR